MDLFKQLETAASGTRVGLDEVLSALRFNSDGLIPAIAQQHGNGEVLMLAWVNREALLETLRTGRACYYSRSRQKLWRKGEESGHMQLVRAVYADCDGDTLLFSVEQTGPACHTNRPSCFYLRFADQNQDTGLTVIQEPVTT